MTKLLKYARMLMMCGLVTALTGCSALLGTIHVETDLSCDWTRTAPRLTSAQVQEIVGSNISTDTLDEINEFDNWAFKHNNLHEQNC